MGSERIHVRVQRDTGHELRRIGVSDALHEGPVAWHRRFAGGSVGMQDGRKMVSFSLPMPTPMPMPNGDTQRASAVPVHNRSAPCVSC